MTVSAMQNRETGGATNNGTTANAIAGNDNSAAGLKNEFLTLMVAQIKNQDPLNPLDGAEYVAQLAQFSTVEGIENMGKLQNQNNVLMDTLQVLQSTNLAGKQVSIPVDRINLDTEEELTGTVALPAAASEVEVRALDAAGNVVESVNLGARDAGETAFTLPELDAGQYTLEVIARNGDDLTTYPPKLQRTVEKVSVPSDGSDIRLQVAGVGSVSLFSISEFLGGRS